MQAAAANLGLVMRTLFGQGTPRGLAESVEPSQQAILEGACTQGILAAMVMVVFTTFRVILPPRRALCAS